MKKIPKDQITRLSIGPRYMTTGERMQLMKHFKKLKGFEGVRDRFVFYFALESGLRCQEIHDMDVGDLFPESMPGYPRKVNNTFLVIGKKNVLREVPLLSEFRDEQAAFLKAKKKAGESIAPDAPLFCTVDGVTRLSRRSLQSIVERYCVRAGLTEVRDGKIMPKFSIHELRHTYAVSFLSRNRDMGAMAFRKLAQILGHADLETTMKYTLFDVKAMEDEI